MLPTDELNAIDNLLQSHLDSLTCLNHPSDKFRRTKDSLLFNAPRFPKHACVRSVSEYFEVVADFGRTVKRLEKTVS